MIDIDKLESLAKAAADHGEKIGEESWYAEAEFICNMLMHPIDAEFAEVCTPSAILALIAEVRALREDAVPVDVRVESYSLPDAEIEIVRVKQRSGPDKWKALHGGYYCLNKAGQWELEPMPSSRGDDFIDRCRFDTAQEAIDAARKEKK